jgi:hypothetical protein
LQIFLFSQGGFVLQSRIFTFILVNAFLYLTKMSGESVLEKTVRRWVKKLIPHSEDVNDQDVRSRYGYFGGWLSIRYFSWIGRSDRGRGAFSF